MSLTLEENGIVDQTVMYEELEIPEEERYIPAIHIHFNDDLTSKWLFFTIILLIFSKKCKSLMSRIDEENKGKMKYHVCSWKIGCCKFFANICENKLNFVSVNIDVVESFQN